MNKVIIFGNNTLNTLGLLRSLGIKGIRPILLLEPCDFQFCVLRFSKYISRLHYLANVEDGLRVLREEYWDEPTKPIVINAGDPAICLLDAHYDELKNHFHIFNANGEQGRINFFMDKSNQFPVAERSGLRLIKTWKQSGITDLPADITYPCLIKGNNSIKSTKEDMRVCETPKELQSQLNPSKEYLIQEFIQRDFELNINGISFNHGDIQFIPAVIYKIRDSFARQGEFLRVDSSDGYPPEILNGIKKLVKEIGYEGLFSVELLKRGDCYYFLEINLRSDGLGYAYTAAGVNYPYLWVKHAMGQLDDADITNPARAPLYVMLEHDFFNVIEHKVSIVEWLKDVHRSNAFFILNAKDLRPFAYYVWILIRQASKKIVKRLLNRG